MPSLLKECVLFNVMSGLINNPPLLKGLETLKKKYPCRVLCFQFLDGSPQPSEVIVDGNLKMDFIVLNPKQQLIQTLLSKLFHNLAITYDSLFQELPLAEGTQKYILNQWELASLISIEHTSEAVQRLQTIFTTDSNISPDKAFIRSFQIEQLTQQFANEIKAITQ